MKFASRVVVASLAALTASLVLVPLGAGAAVVAEKQPKSWDPRVAPIAKQVEKLRGLKFDHPVPVEFLSNKAFEKKVTVDDKKLSKGEKREIEQGTKFLRALGLIHGEVDLLEATNDLQQSDVLAYYSPEDKQVTVKGKTLDVSLKVTLAHELTHVLQDQHFDLVRLQDRADRANTDEALTALVEGDAVRIENEYVNRLSQKDQDAYDKEQIAQGEDLSGILQGSNAPDAPGAASGGDVPDVLAITQGAPYIFGPVMVEAVLADQDGAGVNKLFKHPPTTEQQFLTPSALLRDEGAKKVLAPKLDKGEKEVRKPDPFGAFGLYLTLASRIGVPEALAAADAWGGDQERVFTKKVAGRSTVCVRANFVGRTPADTAKIGAALGTWAAAMPAGAAKVVVTKKVATLESCDPGVDTPAAPNDLMLAVTLAEIRNEFMIGGLQEGVPISDSECLGTGVATDPQMMTLVSDVGDGEPTPDQEAMIGTIAERVATACFG